LCPGPCAIYYSAAGDAEADAEADADALAGS
jgi:hypothetical protein